MQLFEKIIKIQNKKIGINQKTFVIAEIGVNHCGKLGLAKKMINQAIKAGADAVKFQTFQAENLASLNTPKVKYQLKNSSKRESHYQMLKSLELTKTNHLKLFRYCQKKGIIFLSTPYDKNSAVFLNKLGCSAFKTASADIVDLELHNYLAKTNKPVIISTGMADLIEIEKCLKIYKKNKNYKVVLLHCVSNYPCSLHSLNLNSMTTIKKKFKCIVGYSDHSEGNQTAILSIALGAAVIEKHFTTNKLLPGPDQKTSILPEELRKLVEEIRISKVILGNSIKKCQIEEKEMRMVSRKSLTLINDIKKNQIIEKKHLALKRPGTGILFENINKVIGKIAKRNLKSDYQLKLRDLKNK